MFNFRKIYPKLQQFYKNYKQQMSESQTEPISKNAQKRLLK